MVERLRRSMPNHKKGNYFRQSFNSFQFKISNFPLPPASDFAIADVLSHKFDNDLKPVAFVWRALSEQKYSAHEKEAWAIVFCVTNLKQYLSGNVFTLKTDHKPKALPVMAAARIQRWAFILSGFNYKIEHVKGQINADECFNI